eukprot:167143-Pyramimonas_sp.AAC.1
MAVEADAALPRDLVDDARSEGLAQPVGQNGRPDVPRVARGLGQLPCEGDRSTPSPEVLGGGFPESA